MYDEIDLEDIECRLYSRVYHSNPENEDVSLPSESSVTLYAKSKVHNNRYFFKQHTSDLSSFIPLEENNINSTELSSVHNNISFNNNSTNIATEGNFGNPFQNNITVNQYTLPLIINSELSEVLNPNNSGTFFVPWCVKNQRLLEKKNRKRQKRLENRRLKNKEKVNQYKSNTVQTRTRGEAQRKVNVTVLLSDDSDSECVIISDMNKEYQKLRKLRPRPYATPVNNGSDSDDIVYIPLPPVEVINVDEDENENNQNNCEILEMGQATSTMENLTNHTESNEINKSESCACNDFLDITNVDTSNKFNFGLYGSDFNNTGDFVRPADPVEYCETESSCSTNDFNRENSSVKTIVFSEVDFPKEDIFSDKNLEGFSSYITPKRKTSKKSKTNSSVKLKKPVKKVFNLCDSSSSSSETDYESSQEGEPNKKLPTLSPMMCEKSVASKTKKKTSEKYSSQASNVTKHSDKRKSETLSSEKPDDNVNVNESKLTKEKLPKKKKKLSNKKRTLLEDSSSVVQNIDSDKNNTTIPEGDIIINVSDTTLSQETQSCISEKEKTDNPNNREHQSNEGCSEVNNENLEVNADNIIPRKKKKKNSESKKSETEYASNSSSGETVTEKVKKKKRKSVSSESNTNTTELNRIENDNMEMEVVNNKGSAASGDKNESIESPKEVLEQNDEENLSTGTGQVETISNSNDLSVQEPENVVVVPVDPELLILHISDEYESDDDIIVVEEKLSDKSAANDQDCVQIVDSSDSDYDFVELGDVGHDLTLANCLAKTTRNSNNRNDITEKNMCPDGSKFDVEQIQSTQTDDPAAWRILARDHVMFLDSDSYKGPRCNRCRQLGHVAIKCTDKPDIPNCSLCGFSGHQEPRCPNKRCTQCGNEGNYSTTYCWKCVKFRNLVCHICNMRGHVAKNCPDLWRRYHLTTQEGPIVTMEGPQLKPRDQLWCSGCAGQGHLEHECDYYNRQYPPTNPRIMSYEDVLHQDQQNDSRPVEERTVAPTLHLPPVWNTHQQNNCIQNMVAAAPFYNQPSTSQNTPLIIPPVMSQITNINPALLPVTLMPQNQMIMPGSSTSPDLTRAPTQVLNPYSVLVTQGKEGALNQMMVNYINDGNNINHMGCSSSDGNEFLIHPRMVMQGANELLKNDQRRIKRIIMSMPAHVVKRFFKKELADLENIVSQADPRYLKKKLFKYDRISQSKRALNCDLVKEKCFWYRILNMFIFGVHQMRAGNVHINFIKSYVSEPKQHHLDNDKRKSLLNAYNYIFDGNRHLNVNYYKTMRKIINKSSSGS